MELLKVAKVVNVLRGPVHSSEVPDWDMDDDGFGLLYNEGYVLYVTMQDDRGVLSEEELVFEDFDEAMIMVEHFVDQVVSLVWDEDL
jgi:hypothetical protein